MLSIGDCVNGKLTTVESTYAKNIGIKPIKHTIREIMNFYKEEYSHGNTLFADYNDYDFKCQRYKGLARLDMKLYGEIQPESLLKKRWTDMVYQHNFGNEGHRHLQALSIPIIYTNLTLYRLYWRDDWGAAETISAPYLQRLNFYRTTIKNGSPQALSEHGDVILFQAMSCKKLTASRLYFALRRK